MPQSLDLKEMLKAGIHFGHKTARWSPKMSPYIWGAKSRVHLIDISKTSFLLEQTGKFLKDRSAEGKSFLWVGTKKPAFAIVQETATSLNMPYVINRWIGGTLSNFEQVKKAITRLLHLHDVVNKPTSQYTKKELVVIQKEIERLERNVGGIINLSYPPEAVIVVDAKKEQSAVREASGLGIPVIGIVDTNTDPTGVNFVIPANDDSPRSIKFIISYLSSCVQEGMALFEEKRKDELAEKKKATPAAKKPAPVKAAEKAPIEKPAPAKKSTPVKAAEKAPVEKPAPTKEEEKAAPVKAVKKTAEKKETAQKETDSKKAAIDESKGTKTSSDKKKTDEKKVTKEETKEETKKDATPKKK